MVSRTGKSSCLSANHERLLNEYLERVQNALLLDQLSTIYPLNADEARFERSLFGWSPQPQTLTHNLASPIRMSPALFNERARFVEEYQDFRPSNLRNLPLEQHELSWSLMENTLKHDPNLNKEIALQACYEVAGTIYQHQKLINTVNNRINAFQYYGGLIGLQDTLVNDLVPILENDSQVGLVLASGNKIQVGLCFSNYHNLLDLDLRSQKNKRLVFNR